MTGTASLEIGERVRLRSEPNRSGRITTRPSSGYAHVWWDDGLVEFIPVDLLERNENRRSPLNDKKS